LGASFHQTHTQSAIRLRIQEFLSSKSHVGPSVRLTLVRLHKWIASVQAHGLDIATRDLSAATDLSRSSDLMDDIAQLLVHEAEGTERTLLSKALQETLYYRVGFDPSVSYAEFRTRFSQHLDDHAVSTLIKRFLRLYFFHHVWFETGESFRALARTSREFEKYIEDVERICERTVSSVWKSFEKTNSPLDSDTAAELVQKIEQGLRGD
jgi:hypothetical protein